MLRITENGNRLIVRDIPLSEWICGAVFVAMFGGFAVFLFYSAWLSPRTFIGSSGQDPYSRGLQILMFVMLVAFVFGMIALFVSMLLTPVFSTTVDLGGRSVLVRRRGILANSGERFSLSQVKRFEAETVADERGSQYIAIRLVNDDLVRLETDAASDSGAVIDRLNSFLEKA